MTRALPCAKCNKPTKLRRNIVSNGDSQFFWWCYRCERMTPAGTFLKHDEVIAITQAFAATPDDIPVLNNYAKLVKCVVCGAKGAELHHFAPQTWRERFGNNWSHWPTALLCRRCHLLWHQIVTQGLVK